MNEHINSYPSLAKILHLGLAGFGIFAFVTAELAEEGGRFGYLLHAYLGLSLGLFLLLYFIDRMRGTVSNSASGFALLSHSQWSMAWQDIKGLFRLQVPQRNRHEGLAGMTQAFGLLVFSLMALTGAGLFMLNAGPETALLEAVEETHETFGSLVPVYLLLHVGAVILHTMQGDPIWKKMFTFRSDETR